MENSKVREDYAGFMFVTTGDDGRFYILSIDDSKKLCLLPKSGSPDFAKTAIFWSDDPEQVEKFLKELTAITNSTLQIKAEDLLPVSVIVSHERKAIIV